jgi:hypothetical protein
VQASVCYIQFSRQMSAEHRLDCAKGATALRTVVLHRPPYKCDVAPKITTGKTTGPEPPLNAQR